MIWLIVGLLVVVYLWYILTKNLNYFNKLGIKQSRPVPIFGDQWKFFLGRLSFTEFALWVYNMYPDARYSGFFQFTIPTLVIRDPELIKQITVKDFDHFTDHRSFVDPEADPLWSGNLFALKGHEWREMRATMSGSFTGSKLKNMFNLMNETAENFVEFFKNKNEESIEIELKDTFSRYTNDVIATTAFGIKVDSLREPNNIFYEMGQKTTNMRSLSRRIRFFALLLAPKMFKIFKIGFFTKEVSRFFTQIIDETIKTREERGIVRNDMINLLLEGRKENKIENLTSSTGNNDDRANGISTNIQNFQQKKYFSNQDIASQAVIFFFAGFDTISTAMCFASYELAIDKSIQDRLREEIREKYKNNNEKITYDVLLKMKYMDMVISEVVRKWPPAIQSDRVVTKKYVIEPKTPDEKPVYLNPGDALLIPTIGIHRDAKYFPNPDKFDPERFSEENKNSIIPFTYIPFGAGPRICIASRFAQLEIKALLFQLLLNFEIIPSEKSKIPLKLCRKSFNPNAEGGFWFKFKRLYI